MTGIGVTSIIAAVLVTLTTSACTSHKPHSPDLTPIQAAEIISQTPQFIYGRKLVKVNWTIRGDDDMADCCYAAEFMFREIGAGANQAPVKANALFRHWGDRKGWHLQFFDWGDPANALVVWIGPAGTPWP